MTASALPRPLTGVIPPLATPLTERDRLDHAGLERLIEHVLAGGVHGLFILGTTGEAPSLSHRLRCELIERTCAQVAGRVPVLVGITDPSFGESVDLAEFAADAGAAAVVHAGPFYFPIAQPELAAFVERLADALPLPLFLYNMPSHTKLVFEPATVARTFQHSNVAGLKDSGGSMVYFHKVLRLAADRPDLALLTGPEELLAEATLLGGHGGVCGGANLFPRLYVDLYNAARRGDLARTCKLHDRVMQISTTIYSVGPHWSSYLKGVKCALKLLGICDDFVAEPFERFGPAEHERIARHLRELGAGIAVDAAPV